MNKEKPILLFFENLVEPIQTTKVELDLIENEMALINKEFLRKGVFAYIFALFETSLSDCLTRYLYELPAKLPIDDFSLKNRKTDFIKSTFTYKLIESMIDDYLITISYGKLKTFLTKFCDLLSIDDVSNAFPEGLHEKKERRNLLLHNNLIINNKYIENTGSKNNKGLKLSISTEYLIETIKEIRELLSSVESSLFNKYSKYTRYKVIKDIWNYLFDSPILRFENHWIIKNNEIVGYNTETAEKWANNFSGSEKTLLALFLQNFSPGIVDNFLKFDDLSMIVSISNEKVAFIVEVFEKYPLLLQNSSKRSL